MTKVQTERLGVAAIEYFFSEHGWLFREQMKHDYGIDAHIEIVNDGRPTGKLIALQIKSGASYLSEKTTDSIIFRTDDKHAAYWVGHSMPVVVILYDPETKQAYWQQISREALKSTKKSWKLDIPQIDMFEDSERTLREFASLTQPEPYLRRLNKLRVDRKWMDLIKQGNEIRIYFEDWVNKSLPRYRITIFNGDKEEETWPTLLYAPGIGVDAMLRFFFPWADFIVDEDAHREGLEGDWVAECYLGRDSDTGEPYYSQKFNDWYSPPKGIVPISHDGETAGYILILSLNDFGKSFLEIDDYLADPNAPEKIGFTLKKPPTTV
ncbi:DUF4365 domain-containing protein [Chitinimonas sp. BJB300]|uniref:DUF4365 domain-containing protein n=1 Tax=Chitinimonas sp. BJB300 TaxID=1559339 RepID=UPI0018EB622B|nr:DUF4365 domain-containing protein [Chitinimonas sp. BJB300]